MALPMKKIVMKAMKSTAMKVKAPKGMKADSPNDVLCISLSAFQPASVYSVLACASPSGHEEESYHKCRPWQAGQDGRLQGSQGAAADRDDIS